MGHAEGPAAHDDFRAIFAALPGMYLVLTPEFRIVCATRAYLSATKTRERDIVGKGIFEVFPDNPDDPATSGVRNLRSSLERVRDERVWDPMPLQKYDIRRPAEEGGGFEEKFWRPSNSPVFAPDGTLRYIVHCAEDVTEFVRVPRSPLEPPEVRSELRADADGVATEVLRHERHVADTARQLKEANAELAQLYKRTKELEQQKGEFFANVSHELRTPLSLIIGPLEMLLAARETQAAQRRVLELAVSNAKLLLKHVNDLLDASKLEAGGVVLTYSEVDLAALVRLWTGHFASLAEELRIDFQVQAPPALPAQLDPDKVQRAFMNLLSNAFKFTPAGGTVRCSVAAGADGRATIEVADSGPGIPFDKREVVFERFRQLDGGSTRRFGGTGLGLAIARDFTGLHHGSLSVSDASEGGALFTLELPLVAPQGAETRPSPVTVDPPIDEAALAALARRTQALPGGSETDDDDRPLLLVVEDHPQVRGLLCECLATEGRVVSAANGREGLETALALRPDLVLSDMMMPVMNGQELLAELRGRPEFDRTPIVLLTARADDGLRIQLLKAGASDYVHKPFSVDEVRARVGNLLRAKRTDEHNLALNLELQQSNLHLSRLTDQLQEANRELETFSYSVSHDLRAPLRSIDGFSLAILEDCHDQLDAQGRGHLARVRSATQRMGQLIDDLLSLARVARSDLTHDRVDLSAIARDVVAGLRERDPERDVDVRLQDDVIATGDARLLRVALENLLDNAWKYTGRTEGAEIEFGVDAAAGEWTYFVRDNGAGFDEEGARRLFAPFQRLHSEAEFPGTGIGLATVKRILQRHGGRVWAQGSLGRGATISFRLPELERAVP